MLGQFSRECVTSIQLSYTDHTMQPKGCNERWRDCDYTNPTSTRGVPPVLGYSCFLHDSRSISRFYSEPIFCNPLRLVYLLGPDGALIQLARKEGLGPK
jgi:hypothetical protein